MGELGVARPQCGDDLDEVGPDQGFPAGDPEFPDPEALDADPYDSLDFVGRHDACFGSHCKPSAGMQ